MTLLRRWCKRLANFLAKRHDNERLQEEIDSHLAALTDENIRAGMTPKEAARQARLKFGSMEAVRAACHHEATLPLLEDLLRDGRYALRLLWRSPAFTILTVLVLGLAIGANTAVFSVVNTVLLRPLPYPEPDRLILLHERSRLLETGSPSMPAYLDWRAEQRSFTDLAVRHGDTFDLSFGSLDRGMAPERVNGSAVSANYLSVLGVEPSLGRNFTQEEDTPGGPKAVLIGDALWRRFGSKPDIVGRSLTVDGLPCEIVGVLSATLRTARSADIFVPLGDLRKSPYYNTRDSTPGLTVLGRLKPGTSLESARADLDHLAVALQERYPETNKDQLIDARPMLDLSVGEYRPSLFLLLGAVGCVLLIACANVATLQLARATGRTKEMAVRTALGASRARLVRQLLAESTLLTFFGGVAGVLLALWATDVIVALGPQDVPRLQEVRLDWAALGFAATVSIIISLFVGAWPAWSVSGFASMSAALHESGARGASEGVSRVRARSVLVVTQVAVTLVLLVGAALASKAFFRLRHEPLGFRPEHILMMSVSLPAAHYPLDQPEKLTAFHRLLLEQVRALPGVQAAAVSGNPPFPDSDWEVGIHVTGTPPEAPRQMREAHFNDVSPGYFRTMGMPVLRGRDFEPQDMAGHPMVAVIDETMAREFFPGRDPIGQRFDDPLSEQNSSTAVTVVGVVPHVRRATSDHGSISAARGQAYVCVNQTRADFLQVLVRVDGGDPLRLAEPVRQVVYSLDPDLPVAEITSMEQVVSENLAPQRLATALLGTFAVLALGLATMGLYGVMTLSVTQRTRELGIRMALGAQRGDLLALVLGWGARLVGLGIALGLAGALGLALSLSSLFYGVSGDDPLTLTCMAALLGTVALLASYLPARRAMRIDPLCALRKD